MTVPAGSSSATFAISASAVATDSVARVRARAPDGPQVDAPLQLWANLATSLTWTSTMLTSSFQANGRTTPPASTFTAYCSGNSLFVDVRTSGSASQQLSFFGTPGVPLRPGTYTFASGSPNPRLSTSGLACIPGSGEFVVHESDLSSTGDVRRWRATFEYTCFSPPGSTLRGEVVLTNPPKPYAGSCTVVP